MQILSVPIVFKTKTSMKIILDSQFSNSSPTKTCKICQEMARSALVSSGIHVRVLVECEIIVSKGGYTPEFIVPDRECSDLAPFSFHLFSKCKRAVCSNFIIVKG